MKKENVSATAGLCLPAAMFIVLLVLKLTVYATLSWWWVTSPLWIFGGIMLISALVLIIMAFRSRQ